jgi:TonB-dependent starch-binding outer membrane protein SusC
MNKKLPTILKSLVLTLVLEILFFPVYPQSIASSSKLKRYDSQAVNRKKLRDVLLELNSRFKTDILFEEKLLADRIVYDSLIDFNLGIEKNLSNILLGSGLRYEKVRQNTYLILSESPFFNPLNELAISKDIELATDQTESKTLQIEETVLQISGRVNSEDGAGLPGASIVEKGTTNGTTTDADGNFKINVNDKSSVLVFSFVGYLTEEVIIGEKTSITINLVPDIKSLSEVVVVGYGSRERKDVIGAVSDIQSKDIAVTSGSAFSAELALQGRAAGVLVTGGGGDPSARPSINVRGVTSFNGASQPLYVIDGIPVAEWGAGSTYVADGARAEDLRGNQNIFNLINPNDIESISVLKDASSAAIYGLRAANGVVLITTKRGKVGLPKIEFSASYGIRNIRKKLDVLNTDEYTKLYRDQIFKNDTSFDPATSPIYKYYDPSNAAYLGNSPTYDWQKALINENAITANYALSVSGGTEAAKYHVGGGYSTQEGSLKYNTQDRFSFSANSDFKIKKWLEIGETIRVAYTRSNDQRNNTGNVSDLSVVFGTPPWQAIYDPTTPDGLANADPIKFGPEAGINFVGVSAYSSQKFNVLRTLGSAYATIIPVKGLRIKGSVSADYIDNRRTSWLKSVPSNRFSPTISPSAGNIFTLQNTVNFSLIKELSISYSKSFGDHTFDLLVNGSDQESTFDAINNGVANIPTEDPTTFSINAGVPATISASQFIESYAIQGYLGRLNYKFKDKYYLDATIRRDGSSRFAPSQRIANFYGLAAAWRLTSEDFMKSTTFIDDLKLKAGWGQLGNQDTRSFAFLSTVNRNGQYGTGNTANGSGTPNTGAFLGDYANPGLTWEKVTTSNVGVDAAFLRNALTFSAEYYIRTTDGILQGVPFPATTGLNSSPIFNIAKVNNTGVEINMNYRHKIRDIEFNIGVNLTTVKNEVLSLYQGQPLFGNNTRTVEGKSINSIYGYQTDGIFQTKQEVTDWLAVNSSPGNTAQLSQGDFRFRDLYTGPNQTGSPNGVVDGFDQTYLGKTIPGYYYGINLGANYKGFDLNILFQGVGDVSRINNLRRQGEYFGGSGNNFSRSALNSWTPENGSNTTPRAIFSDPSNNFRFSDRWVESGAFFRLNNVQLGYTLPNNLLTRIGGISSARVYVQSTNTFVITNYSGLDPENDFNPTPVAIIFGFNASF